MPTQTFLNLSFEKKMMIYEQANIYFGKIEFEHAKVSELAEKIGVKRRTFYSYFSSLEDIYNYVFAYSNIDCQSLFEGSGLINRLSKDGFTDEIFDVFESYYLSVICSGYGLRKLFEYIKTCEPKERIVLNGLISILKQYELGVLTKQEVKDEVDVLIHAHI